MRRLFLCLCALPVLAAADQPPRAVTPIPAAGGAVGQPSYADLADLALPAPVAAHVRLRRALALRGADAVGVAAGFTRFYVEADVVALIRGEAGMPTQVRYLVDLPAGADGRAPKLPKRSEWLIFARTVPGRPGELQLAAPDAQLPFSPQVAERARAVLRAALEADAPPAITGIGNAFHVTGALPGEGETQIFLQTADSRPVSLSILRRPGERPRWAVALAEIVDEAAGTPPRDTLLWYRLACFLPRTLPARATSEAAAADAQAAREDYGLVLAQLGPCGRTRASGGDAPA